MKTLQSLTQHLDQWRRIYKLVRNILPSSLSDTTTTLKAQDQQLELPTKIGTQERCKPVRFRKRPPAVLLLAVVSLTGTMGQRFYNAPKLDIKTISPQTIRAPFDASVEDVKTTEEKRKEARTGAVPVLTIDREINLHIYDDLQRSLDQVDKLQQVAGSFPYVATAVLSTSTQVYLRNCSEWEWRAILTLSDRQEDKDTGELKSLPSPRSQLPDAETGIGTSPLNQLPVSSVSPVVLELQAYRQSVSFKDFSDLVEKIKQVRKRYAKALTAVQDSGIQIPNAEILFELSDSEWQQTQMGMHEAVARILAQGIPAGLLPSILQEAVRMQLNSLVPPVAEPVATQVLLHVLRPNLKEDKEQTKQLAEQAALAVKPVILSAQGGEVIVREGEAIDHDQFVLLDYFGLSRRSISWRGFIGFAGFVSGGIFIFLMVQWRFSPRLRLRDCVLVLLLTLSTPILLTLGVRYSNLSAIGLLVGSFYGFPVGVTVVGLLTGVLSVSFGIGWDYSLAGAAGAILVSLLAAKMRSREELALLGCVVGLTQGGIYLLVNLISASGGALWYAILEEAALYGLSGLAWSIVALGLSPYLEHLFDLVTPIRLAELANPNRPLLKRLAAETPGTFQHTLFVATLAEAAARKLGCNVELVRAGTLYHDIGKMHDALGFIENQMGGSNKHDTINDPWKSAEIIKKHVSEGLVMARKYRLPKAIQAFIPEHQGTILIAYFYYQAQQDPTKVVREEDFRYPGPIPQSKETGIVMLADACEAALRSLKEVCLEEALSTINKILRARWQDNQLTDSGLTREDLSTIAGVFVQVWQQYNHQRIAYPKLTGSK